MSRPFELSEEDVLVLPVDELALAVLQDVVANEEWNSGNWMVLAATGRKYSANGLNALSEAWQWLHSNGLVAENLEKNNSLHAIFVTRLGHKVASEGLAEARAIQRLAMELHPILEADIRPQYLMGQYELAAFAAMKAIEVRVRELAGAPPSSIGVSLMRNAFGMAGPLRNQNLDAGEQTARMDLFAGSIGAFKNPTSHRDVEFDDPTEAAEVILLADLLMRLLDRIGAEVEVRQQYEQMQDAAKLIGQTLGGFLKPRAPG